MASSDLLFGRRWRVAIGPDGGTGKEWSDLRVAFKVEKTGDASPNKLDLSISNLSAASRAFIAKKQIVRLEAGYESPGPKLLFTGSIELVDSRHEGADWVTRIESGDGVRAYRGTYLTESFGPKTTEEAVIQAIAGKMGVTLGQLKLHPKPKKGVKTPKHLFNHGRALTGPARAALDTLCRSRGLRWSIQDGVLQVLPYREALDTTAVVVSPSTGLIGSPQATETGLKLNMLLLGGVNPGRVLQLDTRAFKGLYIAEKVEHQGDSHGGDWYTTIEAFKLS